MKEGSPRPLDYLQPVDMGKALAAAAESKAQKQETPIGFVSSSNGNPGERVTSDSVERFAGAALQRFGEVARQQPRLLREYAQRFYQGPFSPTAGQGKEPTRSETA